MAKVKYDVHHHLADEWIPGTHVEFIPVLSRSIQPKAVCHFYSLKLKRLLMALAVLGLVGALAARANNKRSRQITDLEDNAELPSEEKNDELYDPLRRGQRNVGTDWLANRALHNRKRWPQPYSRPLHDNGQNSILARSAVGPETAARMQHIYAECLPEAPPFFYAKTIDLNRQIQPYRMPSYHPGVTIVDEEEHEFSRFPMPYNYRMRLCSFFRLLTSL